MATACVLCIGTELTRGEVINSNASFLADGLTGAGFEVTAIETVDDDRARIIACLTRLAAEHAVLVATGGLGPTTDDITTACVAEFAGVPLERDASSLAAIRARFEKLGRHMSDSNQKQADFPRGASILPNPNGTAPGFSLKLGRALSFFMPGVPREMGPMFRDSVVPAIRSLVDFVGNGVSVDDDEAVVAFVEEKRVADPPQVRLALLVDLNAGPDAGVDEQIIAEAAAVGEAFQELDMLGRNAGADDLDHLLG